MKKTIALFSLLSCLGSMLAQKMEVKNIYEITNDISARRNVHLDKNGQECAMLRINIPSIRNVEFDENVFVEKYIPGEFVVYVPASINDIKYSIDGLPDGQIVFSDYDINLKGKSVYRCILQKEDKKVDDNKMGSLSLTSSPVDVIVLLDGIPIGETPLQTNDVSVGEHTVAVANTNGYSIADMKVTIEEGKKSAINLELSQTKPKEFELEIVGGGDSAGDRISRYTTIKKGGKMGVADMTGSIVVPCLFDYVTPIMQNGFFQVANGDIEHWKMKWGLYEPGRGQIVPPTYQTICADNSDNHVQHFMLARKEIQGKWWEGFIDCTGKEIVPFIYKWIDPEYNLNKDGIILVEDANYKRGYLKIEGSEIKEYITPRFENASAFNEGLAMVKDGKNYFILNKDGNMTELPSQYYFTFGFNVFSDGLGAVYDKSNDKIGYVNKEGELIIPCIYNGIIEEFKDGFAVLEKEDDFYYIVSKTGDVVWQSDKKKIAGCGLDPNDYYICEKNGKKGVIGRNGQIVVPFQYDDCDALMEDEECTGFFNAEQDGMHYLYDRAGKILYSCPEGLKVIGCKDNIVIIGNSNDLSSYGYANINSGEIIASCIYEFTNEIEYLVGHSAMTVINDGLAMLILGDRYGFMDYSGNIVVPLEYSAALPFVDGVAFARKQNGEWVKLRKEDILK